MLLIPAIDLKDGQCVRLRQGRMEDDTRFSDDPVAMADRWVDAGARRLHLVDLNGAFAGEPINRTVITDICSAHPQLPIQLGGGIRDEKTIEAYLNLGIQYCILGTRAVQDPAFVAHACRAFPGHIIVGLDAKDGQVAINGWAETTPHTVTELAQQFADMGVNAIIYTDIGRDGMLQGVNVEATAALAQATDTPIIASGGITNLDDIEALCTPEHQIMGAITGRAIYEGTLDFSAGQHLADQYHTTL
ncbi:MAG: 1-(5-phosphoribosyl)-5-[(5-phosphoribosylamino)methylideneamino]imidazole-4-carboxamide isomerase [Pseudomonadota bacterium]